MRRIDALVAAMTGSGGPGAAVGVACRGGLIYQGCFGLADVEWRQPVTPDTVFALASLSKPLTATTVVLLARDGLINLDAAVGDYLPEYAGPGRAALIRHLLTHTSGIPNFLTLPGFRDGAAHLDHTPAGLTEVFAALPLEFPPGTRYGYSNSGYRLLDIIIEKVTGTPFAEVVAERVFRPDHCRRRGRRGGIVAGHARLRPGDARARTGQSARRAADARADTAGERPDEILDLPGHVAPAAPSGPVPAGLAGTYRDSLDAAQLSVTGDRLVVSHAGRAYRMIPSGPARYTDENDPDTRLRVHASALQPAVITIDYPFTWFTGYR
jgi:CubicO group peptidase (beta-lactamase class C family)